MTRLVGVTQGRLVASQTGELQCFPQTRWREEFGLAHEIGLDYIEWLAERRHNPANPIWTDEGLTRIREVCAAAGLRLYSFVNDFVMDHDLTEGTAATEQTLAVLDRASRLGFQVAVVPLYEASEATGRSPRPFVAPLREIADRASTAGITIVLETAAPAEATLALLSALDRPNVGVCFDSGNRAALGQDVYGDLLRLGTAVRHVHIKDKDQAGRNVFLGTGLVDFHRLCRCFAEMPYAGAFTFETPRGHDPLATARFHRQLLGFFLQEAEWDGRGLPIDSTPASGANGKQR